MAGALQLRPIADSDLPFLAELYASTRAEEMARVPWPPEAVRAFLLDQFRLQHLHYRNHFADAAFELVEVDGVPAGRRYVHRSAALIHLVDVALLPAYRRMGLGRRLMAELLEASDRDGIPVELHVEMDNPVLDWYLRLGFEVQDSHGVYHRMRRAPRDGGKP